MKFHPPHPFSMSLKHSVLLCTLLTALFCTPFVPRLPLSLAFLSASVRRAAPSAVRQLREQGLWLVNADLTDIRSVGAATEFSWVYRYRSGSMLFPERRIRSVF
jgi:hypothetical protein